jgi:hypothetical protein
MNSDFIQRNKTMLGIALLLVIVGFFYVKFGMGPSDTQKLNSFNKQLVTLNAPLAVGVKNFDDNYKMSLHTALLRTLYVDAANLNIATKKTLASAQTALRVPVFKNKKVQTSVQDAHDMFLAYVNSLGTVTQNVIVLAQQNGFVAKLPPLVMPSTAKVTENINVAYETLGTPPPAK